MAEQEEISLFLERSVSLDTETSTISPQLKSAFFINRNFTLLWMGQSISNIGDMVFNTTLMLWIATVIARHQSWAPLASSGVLVVTALPTVLLGPIAGVFVDRWDKRRTLLVMDAIRSILILMLLLFTGIIPLPFFAHMTPLWQIGGIYLITLLVTICAQFFDPARFTLLSDIVEPEQRTKTSGLGQTAQSIAAMIGPFIAAPLLFIFGVQWALIVNAASFIISFLTILAVHPPKETVQSEKQQVARTTTSFWQEFKGVLTPSMYLIIMFSTIFFGYLATLLRGHWHATIWIINFGPIDTIFTATGGSLIIGGIYAWRMMHEDVS